MKGLILYCIFVIAGTFADVMAGLFVEYEWSSAWGLTVFLGLFFTTFWIAWVLTVVVMDRLQPKTAKAVASFQCRSLSRHARARSQAGAGMRLKRFHDSRRGWPGRARP